MFGSFLFFLNARLSARRSTLKATWTVRTFCTQLVALVRDAALNIAIPHEELLATPRSARWCKRKRFYTATNRARRSVGQLSCSTDNTLRTIVWCAGLSANRQHMGQELQRMYRNLRNAHQLEIANAANNG